MMNVVRIGCVFSIAALVFLMAGCLPKTQWSENLAPIGRASDPAMNDENIYTEGKTEPMQEVTDAAVMLELDKYTQANIEWKDPIEISKVVIKASKPIVQFEVEAFVDGQWKTVKKVDYNKRQSCPVTFAPVTTNKIRIRIPRAYKVRGKESESLNLTRGGRRNDQSVTPQQGVREIAEIEVYRKIEPPKEAGK